MRIYCPLREDFCPLPLVLYEKHLYEKSVRKIVVRKVLLPGFSEFDYRVSIEFEAIILQLKSELSQLKFI